MPIKSVGKSREKSPEKSTDKSNYKAASFSRFVYRVSKAACQLLACSALLVSGIRCTTTETPVVKKDAGVQPWLPLMERGVQDGGAIVLGYQIMDPAKVVTAEGCRLRVRNTDTGHEIFIPIKPTEPGALVQAEAGHYVTERLGCGISSVWNLEDLYGKGFQVQKGKVSFLGKLIFFFNQKWQLESVKKGTRVENAESLSLLLLHTAKGAENDLVSGFTLAPITKTMTEGARREGFDVFALGVRESNQATLSPLLESLKSCSSEAGKSDPLRFGELEYVAVYHAGRFETVRDRKDNNAFSDDFRGCIENSLRKYTASAKGEVRIRVRY